MRKALHAVVAPFVKLAQACIALALVHCPAALAQEVIPDFYQEPGIQSNRGYVNQHFAEHIDPFNGGVKLNYVDVHLPGNGGLDIDVVRSYNSSSVESTNPGGYVAGGGALAGVGWTVHFGRVLKKTATPADLCANVNAMSVADNPTLELPDGSRQPLAWVPGAGSASTPMALTTARWRADCVFTGAGGLTIYSPDGVRYDMTQLVNVSTGASSTYAWYTKRITDRNGNTIDVSYAGSTSPQISSVVASDGRRVDFTYFDSGLLSRRIATVSAHGATYTYNYQPISGFSGVYQLTSVTRPGGTSWGYVYNGDLGTSAGSHLLRQVRHPGGGAVTYAYDFASFDWQTPTWRSHVVKLKSSSDGGSWSFAYTPSTGLGVNDKTVVTTPAGSITYQHVGANTVANGSMWMVGLLLSKQEGARTETLTWTKQKISSETYVRPGQFFTRVDPGETNAALLQGRSVVLDGASHATSYGNFDSFGNPQTVSESGPNGGNRGTTLSYYVDSSKWIIRQPKNQTVAGGVSITRTFYSPSGNLQSVSRDGVTTSYTYDAQGNVTSATFPRGLVHNYTNHKRGIPQSETQPEAVAISRVVSDAGNVTSETNGESRTTSYGYDGLNRVTSITPPRGAGVSITYGATSKTAARGGLTESTTFDGFGRPTNITLGGIARSYRYDALGRMTFASNPGSSSGTSYEYDALDRVRKITNADSSAQSISYGAASKTVTDERGKSTTFTYRSYGDPSSELVMSVAAADASASISVARDSKGLVTALTQGGISRSFGYNSNGYLTQVTHPETGTTVYGRDAAGNMTTRSVGASGSTVYGYDGQNRLTSVTYPGSTPSVTKTYTKTHKQKTVSSSAASKVHGYDENDNLVSESLTVDGIAFNTGYAYNSLDQMSSITYPRSNRTVSYSPDSLGRPTAVSGFVSSISYWSSGQVQAINHANGAVVSQGQNARLWPSGFSTSKGSSSWISSSFGYDGAGNLTSVSDSVDAGFNRTLAYDSISRLTGASGPWGAGSIAYNGAGNITSQTQGTFTLNYAYDAQNRLSSVSGARSGSFGYDAYGDIVSAPGSTYTYDGVPNLSCVNCADPANKVAYTYDGLNQRVTATKNGVKTYEVYGSNGNLLLEYTPAQGGKSVEYIYHGGKRIAQVDRDNVTTTTLTAAPNPAGAGQPVLLTATVNGLNPSGTVTFKAGTITMGTASVVAGRATFNANFSGAGTRLVTAAYGGDANNAPSTSPVVSMVVNALAPTTTTLSAGPNPAGVNQPVTLTATVAGSAPTGSVSFKDGAAVLGTGTVVGGKATFTTSFAIVGTRSLSATYGGNAGNAGSTSSAVALTVNALAASTATLSASANPVATGQPVTLTASVSGNNPGGSVSFRDGALVLGTAALSAGKATLSTAFTTTGTHSLSAAYGGDAANAAAVSPTLSLAVNPPAIATTASWSLSPVVTMTVGTNLRLQVNVAPAGGGSLPCDPAQGCSATSFGQVQFRDGSTVVGTVQVQQSVTWPPTWTASFNLVPTTSGTRVITAQYLGTTVNAPSSVSTTLNVAPAGATTTTWSSSPTGGTMTVGTSAAFQVAVAPAGGGNLACDSTQGCSATSFGQVQLRDGSTVVSTAQVEQSTTWPPTWTARLYFIPTTAGTHSITAQYLGTTPNAPSSASATINVGPAIATTTSWAVAPATTMNVGSSQWLSVKVAPTSGGNLACDSTQGCNSTSFGQVQFRDGSTVLGTAQVQPTWTVPTTWTASFNFVPAAAGTHGITAQYLGTTVNAPSSTAASVTVN